MSVLQPSLPASPDRAIVWENGRLFLLDQRLLPKEINYIECHTAQDVATAIRTMVVRGAPAIGITAAYGVVLAARDALSTAGSEWPQEIAQSIEILGASRPTAVNLFWALERMAAIVQQVDSQGLLSALEIAARQIHENDHQCNQAMGKWGASLIERPAAVITHCNAGALATGGYGTALGVIRSAFAAGNITRVFADETRPWLQGSRLTAWELIHSGIPVTLMAEGAAASCLSTQGVSWVIVGADRIAANGDTANKIGTYNLALLARALGASFMVAAPTSTIDLNLAHGALIPIEERDPDELLQCSGQRVAAPGVTAWNPVFDVTPAALITALVTEKGVITAPNAEKISRHFEESD